MKVLIVEDDKTSAELLKRMVIEFGYSVTGTASSGNEALELCEKDIPSLVLMDISLEGDLDGVETSQKIKEKYHIPHIFITGNTEAAIFKKANETLPSGYIIKPYNRIILKTTIDMAHYRHDVEKKLKEHQDNLEKIIDERTETLKIFKEIAEQSPQAVVICKADESILYCNKRLSELTGHDLSYYLNNHICCSKNGLIPEKDVWNDMKSRDLWKGEIYNVKKDGSLFYGEAQVHFIKDDKGIVTNYIVAIDDITDKKRMSIEMEKNQGLVEQSKIDDLNNERDWQMWKDKIKKMTITRTDRSLFRNIYNSFNHGAGFGTILSLLEIIRTTSEKTGKGFIVDNDIFNLIMHNASIAQEAFELFSNIDWVLSHDLEMKKFSVSDLLQLIKGAANGLKDMADLKKQVIGISALETGHGSIEVMIEKKFIYQAVKEILLNALKFSKRDTIISVIIKVIKRDVVVSFMSEPEKQGDEALTGIPEEFQQAIFEPFFRLSRYVFEEYKSLDFGLGLTMVEKVITKHNGEILAENLVDHSDLKKSPVTKVNISFKLPVAY
jgi:PAS domain S-box-containing protein